MNKKHYDEASVIRSLKKKREVSINPVDKTIEVLKDNTTVGNGSWGKIDYLCKVHGYHYVLVSKPTSQKVYHYEDKQEDKKEIKREIKQQKLDMTKMVKKNMSKIKIK